MTPSAEIELPTVEIVHDQTPEPVVPLAIFMENMMRSVVILGEEMMAFLASYHVMPDWKGKVCLLFSRRSATSSACAILFCDEYEWSDRPDRLTYCSDEAFCSDFL